MTRRKNRRAMLTALLKKHGCKSKNNILQKWEITKFLKNGFYTNLISWCEYQKRLTVHEPDLMEQHLGGEEFDYGAECEKARKRAEEAKYDFDKTSIFIITYAVKCGYFADYEEMFKILYDLAREVIQPSYGGGLLGMLFKPLEDSIEVKTLKCLSFTCRRLDYRYLSEGI